MTLSAKTLITHSSPHIKSQTDTISIMRNVVWALLPALLFGIYAFGLGALLLVLVTSASCLIGEWLVSRATGRGNSLRDYSALITGLLLAMTLPAALPLWMAAVGGLVAIVLAKGLFGGLGSNPLNPALVGRAFLMAAFPSALTTWSAPFAADRFSSLNASILTVPLLHPHYDGLSGATPLGGLKFSGLHTSLSDLFLGVTGGSLGETSALLILLGGLYLAFRKMLDWRIPVAIFVTVIFLGGALHGWQPQRYPSALFHLFSGGLMLGAVFMATDMVTSPNTARAIWIYGAIIGIIVVVIRLWGGLPEGVMYAILFGNACRPLIERFCSVKPFGRKQGEDHMNSAPLQQSSVPTWPLVRALGGVGTICAFLIVITWQITKPTITAKKAVYLESAIYRVLPGAKKLRCLTLKEQKLVPAARESTDPDLAIYAGYSDSGALIGIALTAHGAGFQDTLRLLYGYEPSSQKLIGFEVLESRETPGLGDKIEKDPAFQQNFKGLDVAEAEGQLSNPIKLVPKGSKSHPGEIDAISGATISSRAVATILGSDTATRLPLIHQQYGAFAEWQP